MAQRNSPLALMEPRHLQLLDSLSAFARGFRRWFSAAWLAGFAAVAAIAQTGNVVFIVVDPSGPCLPPQLRQYNTVNGKIWQCNAPAIPNTPYTWGQVGGGAGTAGWFTDGTTIATANAVSFPGSSSTGGWAYNSGAGTITAASGATVSIGTTVLVGAYTIAAGAHQLPAAASGNNNYFATVTDGVSASDCTVGGGSSQALCISNGSAWVALGGSSGTTAVKLYSVTVGSGGVTAGHLVKYDTNGTIIAVTGTESILGVAQQTASAAGTADVVMIGASNCVAEGSITAGHYLIAGTTDPTACKDSGQTSLASVSTASRIAGKAAASATTGNSFAMDAIGAYRFGALVQQSDLPSSVCVPTTYTTTYTDAAFIVASATATQTLVTLPSGSRLCGATFRNQTNFAGTSITAMSCSLGTPTSGNSTIYLPSLSAFQTAQTLGQGGNFLASDLSTPDSSLAVLLTCTSTGANFGNGSTTVLTAGKLWTTVWTMALPAGN